jgi:hypothetical protein
MKILLLVILMTHYFSGQHNVPVLQKAVSSPEAAAIELWEYRQSATYPEPQGYTGHLYEIDLNKKTIIKIQIPDLKFQNPEGVQKSPVAKKSLLGE